MPTLRHYVWALLIPLLWGPTVAAQTQTEQVLQLGIGDVMEIVADGPERDRQTGWILERNGEFVQAERGPVFQARFAQAGSYTLKAESATAAGTDRLTMQVVVGDSPAKTDKGSTALVRAKTLVQRATHALLELRVTRDDVAQLLIDTHLEKDTNGDGKAVNDNILVGTFFAGGTGTLYLWLPALDEKQTMLIGARLADGTVDTQQLVLQAGSAITETPEEPSLDQDTLFTHQVASDGMVQFVFTASEEMAAEPYVTLWSFGDGQQSMLDAPTHRYATASDYTVRLTVRSLRSGVIVLEDTQTVTITADQLSTGDGVVTPETPEPKPENPTAPSDGKNDSILKLIIIGFVLLVISLVVGLVLVFILSKLRGGKLEETLAAVEDKHFSDEEPDTSDELPPMAMPEEPVVDAEVVEASPEEPTPVVVEDTANVPSWLAAVPKEEVKSEEVKSEENVENNPTEEHPSAGAVAEAAPKKEVKETSSAKATEDTKATEETKEIVTPPWLQGKEVNSEKVKSKENVENNPNEEQPSVAAVAKADKPTNTMSKEEREKERKRRKRQRYRQNKKAREGVKSELVKSEKVKSEPIEKGKEKKEGSDQKAEIVTPPWLQEKAKAEGSDQKAAPKEEVKETSSAKATEDKKETEATEEAKELKGELKPKEQDIPPADENEVKFVISADSLDETQERPEDQKKE